MIENITRVHIENQIGFLKNFNSYFILFLIQSVSKISQLASYLACLNFNLKYLSKLS